MINAWEAKARADAISLQETRVNAVLYEIDREIQEMADAGVYYISYFIPQKVRDLKWELSDTKALIQQLQELGFTVTEEEKRHNDWSSERYLLIRWDEIKELKPQLDFGF